MLQVGKKYLNRANKIVTCLYVDDDDALLVHENKYKYLVPLAEIGVGDFPEYVEPRREFFNAYRDTTNNTEYFGPYGSRGMADGLHDKFYCGGRYGVLEMIHHSDTKVESVFHLTGGK